MNDCERTGNGVSNRGKRRGAFQCCKAAAKLGEKKDVTSWNSTAIFSKNFAIPKWVVEGSWGMIGKQLEHLCEDPWVKKNKQFDKFTSQWHLECFIEGFTQLTTQPETVNLKFLRLIPKFCNDFPPEKKAGQHRFRFLLLDFRKKTASLEVAKLDVVAMEGNGWRGRHDGRLAALLWSWQLANKMAYWNQDFTSEKHSCKCLEGSKLFEKFLVIWCEIWNPRKLHM